MTIKAIPTKPMAIQAIIMLFQRSHYVFGSYGTSIKVLAIYEHN
jgi:hypothetical protein